MRALYRLEDWLDQMAWSQNGWSRRFTLLLRDIVGVLGDLTNLRISRPS
jgi:hypothetical protein